ncbi:MAG: low molecular weight phosphotyrosine protein phosphatase [Clostridia bacterium]|nr:low molecular weight phosphotyrosine protein phosphatase [Clostridia bacterium]
MTKILFVCLGNICRSPMAKFIFIDLIKQKGLENDFYIDSAATSSEEVGNGIYYNAKMKLDEKNIANNNHVARQINIEDYKKFDYIMGMEKRNVDTIIKKIGNDNDKKVYRLLDFSDEPRDISDPWYTRDFERAYNDIYEGCESLLNHILNDNAKKN